MFNNLQEADNTLRRIGRLQRNIKSEEVLLNDAIEHLKKETERKVIPLREEFNSADRVLLDWIKDNKRIFTQGATKSQELTYGGIGLRDSVSVPKAMPGQKRDEIAKSLLKAGFRDCVKVEYKWIKNAVKALDTSLRPKLERLGIMFTRVRKDQPFYTINEQKIAEEA